MNLQVKKKFLTYPGNVRPKIEYLRKLILEVASSTPGVGQLEETLKWGDPSFLTKQSQTGTTIRIAWHMKHPERYGIYFNCQTSLIHTFQTLFPGLFEYEGKRAILFGLEDQLPERELKLCISMALRYHIEKNTYAHAL